MTFAGRQFFSLNLVTYLSWNRAIGSTVQFVLIRENTFLLELVSK